MKYIIPLVMLLIAGMSLSAEDQRMHLVQHKDTKLILKKLVRENDLYASFSGQIWVVGTVIGRWPNAALNMNDKEPDFILVPNHESIDQLPYFFLKEPPYFNQYKVRSIALINGSKALRIAVGDDKLRTLLERRVNHVHASDRFLIDHYAVGVECDAPWAKAMLLQAEMPEQIGQYLGVPEGC